MAFNFQQFTVIIFLILILGGAVALVEQESTLTIDNTATKESEVLSTPKVITENKLPKSIQEFPEITDPSLEQETLPSTTPPPVQNEVVSAKPESELPVFEISPEVLVNTLPIISFSEINISSREAVVNILCTTKSTGSFKPISGSGVIIDERGIILTNAHIAQYFLLKDYRVEDFITCTIRTGSPARPEYRAELLHISPEWIEENAEKIEKENPTGTGENDFAFLRITEHTNPGKNIPETFPFIEISTEDTFLTKSKNVLLAGYSAGFLGGIAIQKDLYISSTIAQIGEVFTFKTLTIDLFSVGGSVVAQAGSSGGAVVDDRNKLLGIIVTSSAGDTTSERDLRALSLSHINRSLIEHSTSSISTLLSGDLRTKAIVFNESIAPNLTKLLTDVLD